MKTHFIFPQDINPRDKIPLVLLHGYGSNEEDLYALKNNLPTGYFPVSLRAYEAAPFGGFAWYPLQVNHDGSLSVNENEILDAARKIREDLSELKQIFNFRKPYSLLGFSQGSILSYVLLSHFPEMFKNIVAFSGYIHEPVMNEPEEDEVIHLKVFVSHGIYDEIIPVEQARKIPVYLKRHHIYYEYKEYSAGHFLVEENVEDAMRFLKKFSY